MKVSQVKRSIIASGVNDYKIDKSLRLTHLPKAGDLAVFKVLEIGKHDSIQSTTGNNCYIFPGDYILAAFGNRYATEQFEGYVPDRILNRYHILGKGGAVGILASMHEKLEQVGPTTLRLVGYAVNKTGEIINTKYYEQETLSFDKNSVRPYKVILSLGASMDSGKTTSASYVCRGLRAAKKRVAYVKLTGTVYTKDMHFARDCGAQYAIDFSKMGFPSTYLCSLEELLNLYETLLQKTQKVKPDYVVVEIADGLLQRETEMLLMDRDFMSTVSAVIYSAPESMSALNGISVLEKFGIRPFAVSGLFTASPLLREEVSGKSEIPVKHISELGTREVLDWIEESIAEPNLLLMPRPSRAHHNGEIKRMPVASAI